MANVLADPLCRHWFRMHGGDPDNPTDPWGIMLGLLSGMSPTLLQHGIDGDCRFVEYCFDEGGENYVQNMDEASEHVDNCVKAFQNENGYTIDDTRRELIVSRETIDV